MNSYDLVLGLVAVASLLIALRALVLARQTDEVVNRIRRGAEDIAAVLGGVETTARQVSEAVQLQHRLLESEVERELQAILKPLLLVPEGTYPPLTVPQSAEAYHHLTEVIQRAVALGIALPETTSFAHILLGYSMREVLGSEGGKVPSEFDVRRAAETAWREISSAISWRARPHVSRHRCP